MTADVLVHAKEVAAYATDSDDTRYCQSVIVALAARLEGAESILREIADIDPNAYAALSEFRIIQRDAAAYQNQHSSEPK